MLVKLRRNGAFELYDDREDKFVKIISKNQLFKFMLMPIRLESGLTLGEAVFAAPDQIWDIIPWSFAEHIKEMQWPFTPKADHEPLERLEILQTIIVDDGEDYDPDRKGKFKVVGPDGQPVEEWLGLNDLPPLTKDDMKSVEVYTTFHGISYPKTSDEENGAWKKGDVIPYGIGFTPANELRDIPIVIKHRNESHLCINKERKVVVAGDDFGFNPSVLDFYYAIVYELTWYGPPAARNETINELRDRVDEIKEREANEDKKGDEDETH